MPDSSGALLAKKPHLENRFDGHQDSRKSSGYESGSSTDSRKKLICVRWHFWCVTVFNFIWHHLPTVVQVSTLFQFLDQWRSITLNRILLNMVNHFHLRCCPLLFHNFKQFNIKTATAHCPVIQHEVNGLIAKGAIEPSTGGAAFYWNLFVVPKHTGGLWPILNSKEFNCYMHIPTFKMHTIRQVWQLIQQDYYFSLLSSKTLICIFPF